jgi:hypothetical protein
MPSLATRRSSNHWLSNCLTSYWAFFWEFSVIMRAIVGQGWHRNLTAVAYLRDQFPATRYPFQENKCFKVKKGTYNRSFIHFENWASKLQSNFRIVAQTRGHLLVFVSRKRCRHLLIAARGTRTLVDPPPSNSSRNILAKWILWT